MEKMVSKIDPLVGFRETSGLKFRIAMDGGINGRNIRMLAEKGFANPDEVGAAATEYLHLMGYVAVGWQWLRMATVAQQQLAAQQGEPRFLEAKLKTARFFFGRLLPEAATLLAAIQAGSAPIMAFAEDEF